VFQGNAPRAPKSLAAELVSSPSLCLVSAPESEAGAPKQRGVSTAEGRAADSAAW